jgi:hypothetical protein
MARPVRNEDHWLWIGGPVPRGSQGITLGSLIIVRAETFGSDSFNELLRHERVHVEQFRCDGTLRFVRKYLWSYVVSRCRGYDHHSAYRRIPYEIEARWYARWLLDESTASTGELSRSV